MGGCNSNQENMTEDKQRDNWIRDHLRVENKQFHTIIKLLMLGPGESGKSTFVKQMRLLYSDGFNEEEKTNFKYTIHSNVLVAMKTLLHASEILELKLTEESQVGSN
jgi:GTPase SAR1 family protein